MTARLSTGGNTRASTHGGGKEGTSKKKKKKKKKKVTVKNGERCDPTLSIGTQSRWARKKSIRPSWRQEKEGWGSPLTRGTEPAGGEK